MVGENETWTADSLVWWCYYKIIGGQVVQVPPTRYPTHLLNTRDRQRAHDVDVDVDVDVQVPPTRDQTHVFNTRDKQRSHDDNVDEFGRNKFC